MLAKKVEKFSTFSKEELTEIMRSRYRCMRMSLLNIDQGKEVSEGRESPGSLVSGYCELARQKRFNINFIFFSSWDQQPTSHILVTSMY